jgi:hypothetical protein
VLLTITQKIVGPHHHLQERSYVDQGVFDLPYATDYNRTATPNFPTILGITSKYGASTYYAQ